MDRATISCLYFVCIFSGLIFLGLPSAPCFGLVTTPLTATSARALRRPATALKAQGEGKDSFAEGREVILLAPPTLAGTKATVVKLVDDDRCEVQLPGGNVFKIPLQNLEAVPLTKTSALEKDAPALADETMSQQTAQAQLKDEQEQIFEEASPKEEPEQILEEASPKEEPENIVKEASPKEEPEQILEEASPKEETEQVLEEASLKEEPEKNIEEASLKEKPEQILEKASLKEEPENNFEEETSLKEEKEQFSEKASLKEEPKEFVEVASLKEEPEKLFEEASLTEEQEQIFEEAWLKEEKEQIFEEASLTEETERTFETASLEEEEEKNLKEKREEVFAEGQTVILTSPPVLAGTEGKIVALTRGGDYAVQLLSGSVFLVQKNNLKSAHASGGGGGAGAGGSGRGYGGGAGLPPRRAGNGRGDDEPERSKAGRLALLVKLVLFFGIFYRLLRWMLRNLPKRRQDVGLLRQVDRLPAKLAGSSSIGKLIAYLCLALVVVCPELLAWFKNHAIALMSKAGKAAEIVQPQVDMAGSTEDKWIAMWPLAVLVLAIILWRAGNPDDKESSSSSNQYILKYDGLSLKDINQYLFKAELRQRLHEHGVVRSQTAKLNIELQSGSVIASIRGPVEILRSVKAIHAHKLRVMGIAPKSWR